MKWCLCALVAVILPLTHGQLIKKAYPTFSQCDQNVISSIKAYWNTTGIPKNTLQKMEESDIITLRHTSYSYLTSIMKCVYLQFKKGVLTGIFVPINGNPSLNITYNVKQGDDGIITGRLSVNNAPEYGWNWYQIYDDKGISSCYVCSEVSESQEAPLLNIMMTKKDVGLLDSSEVETLYNLIQGWGIKFTHHYGKECIIIE